MSLEERVKYAEMKTRHQKRLRPWYKKWWGATILIILGLFLIFAVASGFYVFNKVQEIKDMQSTYNEEYQKVAYQKAILGTNPYYLGTNNPTITIVEFSDFACPYCQKSASEIKGIVSKYSNKVKLLYRDYPLHENSIDLAIAARCAGEQNKFWLMHDKLFELQDELTETDDALKSKLHDLAQVLGLNTPNFDQCLSERRYIDLVRADYDDGNLLEIGGTPTWFVNNYRITGHISADDFENLVTGLLQQYGTN